MSTYYIWIYHHSYVHPLPNPWGWKGCNFQKHNFAGNWITEEPCMPTPTLHWWGGKVNLKNNSLLGIKWKLQICTQNSCLPAPTSHWCQGKDQFTSNILCLELHKVSRTIHICHVYQISTGVGWGWHPFQKLFLLRFNEMSRSAQKCHFCQFHPVLVIWNKTFLLGIEWTFQIFTEKSCLPTPPFMPMVVNWQMFFARNWMKYPDLHRKFVCYPSPWMKCADPHRNIMFTNIHFWGWEWLGVNFQNIIVLEIKWYIHICPENRVYQTPSPMGWDGIGVDGKFTK